MPKVPSLNPQGQVPDESLGDMTPGPSQIMMAAAGMHGQGRLLDSGASPHVSLGGAGGIRMPKRSKGFSQRGRRG